MLRECGASCFIVVLPGLSMYLLFNLLTWKIYHFNCIVGPSSEIVGLLLAAYEELGLLLYLKMLVRTFRCLDLPFPNSDYVTMVTHKEQQMYRSVCA